MVTLLRNDGFFPKAPVEKLAYIQIGTTQVKDFGQRLHGDMKADTFSFLFREDAAKAEALAQQINSGPYDAVIIGVYTNVRTGNPANNFNITPAAIRLWTSLQENNKVVTFLFGNVYAAKNFCTAKTLVAMHQDDAPFQQAAADFLRGSVTSIGKLPVTVCNYHFGTGIAVKNLTPIGTTAAWLSIDSIVNDGLVKKAFPGAVVMAIHNGEIKYHKAFGNFEFDTKSLTVTLESIYDLASVTKISATTVGVMKLYEEGKLDLDKTLGDYLSYMRGTEKAGLTIREILLHQAGLNPFIQFYRETIDTATGMPSPAFYSDKRDTLFTIPVARNIWLRRDWNDTMLQRIVQSKLGPAPKYVYSDNDFILLGKIVQTISGIPLDQYVQKTFYNPMGMTTTTFKPWQRFGIERVVPTEEEKHFRRQLLRGYVHDEGASMFGGVSGHAGLFSNAFDLAMLYQMLLNGGELNGERYLKPETVQLFTAYSSDISRRGLGFDKPEKDNASRKDPYPSSLASPETFGHTGFTGTCVWVDPQSKLVYVFLSNRVYNTRSNNLLGQLGIRGKIQDAIYRALKKEEAALLATSPKSY